MASIDAIEGMGVRFATKLRKARIRTTEGLLRRAGNRKGRQELASQTGIPPERLLEWVHLADLMRVKGIGSEYAELLGAVGVTTLRELRKRNPRTLTAALVEMNDKKRLVRRLPTEGMVAAWVEEAKTLEPMVQS